MTTNGTSTIQTPAWKKHKKLWRYFPKKWGQVQLPCTLCIFYTPYVRGRLRKKRRMVLTPPENWKEGKRTERWNAEYYPATFTPIHHHPKNDRSKFGALQQTYLQAIKRRDGPHAIINCCGRTATSGTTPLLFPLVLKYKLQFFSKFVQVTWLRNKIIGPQAFCNHFILC